MILATIAMFVMALVLVGTRLGRYNSKKDELIKVSRPVPTYSTFKEIDIADEIKRINAIMGKVVYYQLIIEYQ